MKMRTIDGMIWCRDIHTMRSERKRERACVLDTTSLGEMKYVHRVYVNLRRISDAQGHQKLANKSLRMLPRQKK